MSPRQSSNLDPTLVAKLHSQADADRWGVSLARFAEALEASVARALAEGATGAEVEEHLARLHVRDLALACACADGHEAAWEHFVEQHRPALYRAADALDPGGGARDLADALFAELFGVSERGTDRVALLRYFHGRSSLSTWLRAVLAQRHIDLIRGRRRLEPLREDATGSAVSEAADSDRHRYVTLIGTALALALARLTERDRLRLALYYRQQLKLAQIGRILREHEATVSRQLASCRRAIRDDVDRHLRSAGLTRDEIDSCFESVMADAGPLDMRVLLGEADPCKSAPSDRSI